MARRDAATRAPRRLPPAAAVLAAHAVAVLWLFSGPLLEGRSLYFRDITYIYYPDYVFLSRALAQGLWPLWQPDVDAGRPFLTAYPVDLALVRVLGPLATLAVGPALHVLLAMCGASALARRLGLGGCGVWTAGAVYGLSGYVLSCVNLFPYLQGAAWAPWVLVALEWLLQAPSLRRAAVLAGAAALQLSTFSPEVALQTAIAAPFVVSRPPGRRHLPALTAAAGLAFLLAAPAILGVRAMLAGTPRGSGFSPELALGWSATPLVLLESLWPRLFGDVHTFSDVGYWGQPFYTQRYPYLLSLYLGPTALLLAARARSWRLWALAGVGLLAALGAHGPLEAPLRALLTHMRTPVKFFFLTTLAVSLLAAVGIDRARSDLRRPRVALLLPGGALLVAGLAVLLWPMLPGQVFSSFVPELAGAHALHVARSSWPRDLMVTAALCLGAGAALAAGPRLAALAGVLAALDLLVVNGRLNPSADRAFYELQPQVRALVEAARSTAPERWFSYGALGSPGLRFSPEVATRNSDVWLYYMDRQSLLPRTNILDRIEAAYDEDRTGLAFPGSTLTVAERRPAAFALVEQRLRQANVRWVLSFEALPAGRAVERQRATLSEVVDPLRLYELTDAWPRAFWTASSPSSGPDVATTPPPDVRYERVDPHTVRLRARTPPGFLVVLDAYDAGWQAVGRAGPAAVQRVGGRYMAIATPGGEEDVLLSFRPAWRIPALALCGVGVLLGLGCAYRP